MRLDKWLKLSRVIKRRTIANEACDKDKVTINSKIAKASTEVRVGDLLEITMGLRKTVIKIVQVPEHHNVTTQESKNLYELLSDESLLFD